jgi:hypothetical protein
LIKSIVNSDILKKEDKYTYKMPEKKDLNIVIEFYHLSVLLIESRDLIIYDHVFSNEFKIGMFVPIMLPILYMFVKSLKYVLSKE